MTITYDSGTNIITVAGYSETTPCTFEDIYQADQSNGWGVVSKQSDGQYYFECKLNIGDGTTETWLIDTKKAISFTLIDNFITIKNYGHLRCGEVISESKRTTKDGCYFYSSAPATKKLIYVESHGTLELYSSLINSKAYLQISSSEINKIWNSVITGPYCSGFPTPQVNIYNVLWSSAQYGIQMVPINASDVTIANCYYGMYLKAMHSNYNISNFEMIDETYSFRTYNFNGNLYAIDTDCKWTFYWGYASSGKVYRQYTFVPKIVDENNYPIENAEIFLLNNKGEQQFNETTDSNGEISEQTVTHGYYIKDTGNTLNTEEPHTLYIRKYGYVFKTITKQFTARTEETIVLDKNEFLDLTEAEALALTGISYTPPTKVNYGDEVHTNFTTTGQLDHYPICQAEYFAIFGYDGTNDNVLLNRVDGTPSNDGEYSINWATGQITFYNDQNGHEVKPVYSYGGKIVLTNGGGGNELNMNQLYSYLQAQRENVLRTVNGKDYTCYVDLQIGDDTTIGSLKDSEKSISFVDGYGYSFGSAGGFIDLYAISSSGGGATAEEIWTYSTRTLTHSSLDTEGGNLAKKTDTDTLTNNLQNHRNTVEPNIDAKISSRLASDDVRLNNLDVAVSTRSSHTPSDVDSELSSTHGSGSWEGAGASDVADAVWDEKLNEHQKANTTGYELKHITGGIVPRQSLTVRDKEKILEYLETLLKKLNAVVTKLSDEQIKKLANDLAQRLVSDIEKQNELRDRILLSLADINTLEELFNYEHRADSSGIPKKETRTSGNHNSKA